MLLVRIVTNFVQHRVSTAKITAPPQMATTISLSPNSWWGNEMTQKATVTADTMAPAKPLTSAEAIGCVDPKTAPRRPETTARAEIFKFLV